MFTRKFKRNYLVIATATPVTKRKFSA